VNRLTQIVHQPGVETLSYTYDSMNRRTNETRSSTGARFLFTGREWIAPLGLYDYRNRTYSPTLGRFLQTDPIRFDAGDGNLYRYVANNPVNWIDPQGTIVWKPIIIAAWAYKAYRAYKGAKNLKKLQKHVDKANEAGKQLEKLKGLCPKGKKAQDELKKQIEKLENEIKGHQKEINQKWPGATFQ
jgi:RHS repeat-associated protein